MKKYNTFEQKIEVEFAYPVVFGHDLFAPDNTSLVRILCRKEQRRHKMLVFVDSGVAPCHPALCISIEKYAARHSDTIHLLAPPRIVPGGETIKNDYRLIMEMLDMILEYQLCRHSFVVIVGGGAVLDAAGFAASLVHR